MSKRNKTGGTPDIVFCILGQVLMYPIFGSKVMLTGDSHDVPHSSKGSSVTLYVTDEDEGVEIDPDTKDVLRASAEITGALALGKNISVKRLPCQEEEEMKFTITIHKQPKTDIAGVSNTDKNDCHV